jgi:hypothetical protein
MDLVLCDDPVQVDDHAFLTGGNMRGCGQAELIGLGIEPPVGIADAFTDPFGIRSVFKTGLHGLPIRGVQRFRDHGGCEGLADTGPDAGDKDGLHVAQFRFFGQKWKRSSSRNSVQ